MEKLKSSKDKRLVEEKKKEKKEKKKSDNDSLLSGLEKIKSNTLKMKRICKVNYISLRHVVKHQQYSLVDYTT